MRMQLHVVQTHRRLADAPPAAEPLWRGPGVGYFLVQEEETTALYRAAGDTARANARSGHLRQVEVVRRPRRR
jgi:hypothetical protein